MKKLALLGVKPLKTKPFPKWSIYGAEEKQAVLKVIQSGNGGGGISTNSRGYKAHYEVRFWFPQNHLLGTKKDIQDIANAIIKIKENIHKLK